MGGRLFDPCMKGFDSCVRPSEIVWYDEDDEVSRICRVGRRSKMPLVMWIDGACQGNGTAWASGGYGIYLGRKSRYNCCGQLPASESHTSQTAEIFAARKAVNEILNKMGYEVCRHGVVIVTDSDYLVRAMTDYIYNWVDNGFLNARGRPVVNGEYFERLHRFIDEWEAQGIAIRFWKVPREQNQHADRLANKVFDD